MCIQRNLLAPHEDMPPFNFCNLAPKYIQLPPFAREGFILCEDIQTKFIKTQCFRLSRSTLRGLQS